MTDKQLQFLKKIWLSEDNRVHHIDFDEDRISENEITSLINEGFVNESIGEGYIGGLRTLTLTDKGADIAKDYCDTCGCLPCDCLWGYE